jgi:hypothetical protein
MTDWDKVAKCVELLGSDHVGEVAAAVAAIRRIVPFNEVAARIRRDNITIEHRTIIVRKYTQRQWAEGERDRERNKRESTTKIK